MKRRSNIFGATFVALFICVFLFGRDNVVRADPTAVAKPQVDVYVLGTTVNSSQPCTPPDKTDADAVQAMIVNQLPSYSVAHGTKPGPDILSATNYPQGHGAHVIIATVCKTLGVYAISVSGYWLGLSDDDQTSGSLSGTFDALESSDWSNIFGTGAMFANAAFLPVSNDTNNVVNPRLVRNLPITLIATPAPAPIAPPPPGQPPPPLPPTTRLKECQASAYRMLIVGRVLVTSASSDVSRLIAAGSALQFHQPGIGGWYQGGGVALSWLYNPASADVSVDFFICPDKDIAVWADSDPDHKQMPVRIYKKDKLYQIGGDDASITGHQTMPAFGVNPYVNQKALDHATVDLANQLDCVIYRELKELQIKDYSKKQQAIYGPDDLGHSDWCARYYYSLKAFEGQYPTPVTRPTLDELKEIAQ